MSIHDKGEGMCKGELMGSEYIKGSFVSVFPAPHPLDEL